MDYTRLLFLLSVLLLAIVIGVSLYHHNDVYDGVPPEVIQKLTRQTARWLVAAQQDESPMIAALHGQYGMGYLWALSDITTPASFKAATGQDWERFEAEALKIQDEVSREIAKACPQYVGDVNKYLGRIAGDI